MLLPLFATSVPLIPELTCVLKHWKLMSHMSYESLTLSSWFFQVDPSCSHKAWRFDEGVSSFFILITELLSFLFLSANSASHWFWGHLTIWKLTVFFHLTFTICVELSNKFLIRKSSKNIVLSESTFKLVFYLFDWLSKTCNIHSSVERHCRRDSVFLSLFC